ncbi:hypothetical protein GUJ93_ZPchr0005g14793 [Zizania palustris]|uniref:Uncharacterized protein n=1 Tax=Zizania palustris TaxID=103762 RepID=A0A8J5SMI3_ZIZPA|nr:hypothetical protein GUJ93_ZPchr0005g14793 [Zizania palustris]
MALSLGLHIVCSHVLGAFILASVITLPEPCITKRWTKKSGELYQQFFGGCKGNGVNKKKDSDSDSSGFILWYQSLIEDGSQARSVMRRLDFRSGILAWKSTIVPCLPGDICKHTLSSVGFGKTYQFCPSSSRKTAPCHPLKGEREPKSSFQRNPFGSPAVRRRLIVAAGDVDRERERLEAMWEQL